MSATVTFSLEVELGWGVVQYDNLGALSQGRDAETTSLERLLDLCDELDIQISFNIVGHLLRDCPMPFCDSPHEGGWFDRIPKTDPEQHPEFYAPDLVRLIESAAVDHEICTHTFTHVESGNVSYETLRWEFENVLETHEQHGLDRPVSVVPPRHSTPPRDILREFDIEIVRSPRARAPDASEASNRFELGKDILTGTQPITLPRIVDSVVETYCTRFPSLTAPFLPSGQQEPHSVFKTIPLPVRQRLHTRNMNTALSTAIERDSYVHLWSHLWETANDAQWPQIEEFLHRVARARNRDQVQIETMEGLNRRIRSERTGA